MKKNIIVIIVVLMMFGITSSTIYSQQRDKNLAIESVVGHALFMVISGYEEILSRKDSLAIDDLSEMNLTLVRTQAYSDTIDRAVTVDQPLLGPIAESLLAMSEEMKSSYSANQSSFTERDKANYSMMQQEIANVISLIYQNYYVEGLEGKAALEIAIPQELIDVRNRLNNQLQTTH